LQLATAESARLTIQIQIAKPGALHVAETRDDFIAQQAQRFVEVAKQANIKAE
jgi:hypothetical protein